LRRCRAAKTGIDGLAQKKKKKKKEARIGQHKRFRSKNQLNGSIPALSLKQVKGNVVFNTFFYSYYLPVYIFRPEAVIRVSGEFFPAVFVHFLALNEYS
jgi:hypothetical protein